MSREVRDRGTGMRLTERIRKLTDHATRSVTIGGVYIRIKTWSLTTYANIPDGNDDGYSNYSEHTADPRELFLHFSLVMQTMRGRLKRSQTDTINHKIHFYNIAFSNWNTHDLAFLKKSSDSIVEELLTLLFQRAICRADNYSPS